MVMMRFRVMGYGGDLDKYMLHITDEAFRLHHIYTKVGMQVRSNAECAYMHADISSKDEAEIVLRIAEEVARQDGYDCTVIMKSMRTIGAQTGDKVKSSSTDDLKTISLFDK